MTELIEGRGAEKLSEGPFLPDGGCLSPMFILAFSNCWQTLRGPFSEPAKILAKIILAKNTCKIETEFASTSKY